MFTWPREVQILTSQPGESCSCQDRTWQSIAAAQVAFAAATHVRICVDAQGSSETPATLVNILANKSCLNVQPDVPVEKVLKAFD